MKKPIIMLPRAGQLLALALAFAAYRAQAQTPSSSSLLVAQPIPDRSLTYGVADAGAIKSMLWGLDTAWPSETNVRRGVAFMGSSNVGLMRLSFQPTQPLVNGDLQQQQIDDLNNRIRLATYAPNAQITLNDDHPYVDNYYVGNPFNWSQLYAATMRRVQQAGRTVVSIAPFNEPDYTTSQYQGYDGKDQFFRICGEMRNNALFNNIRISGGNTLNNDEALPWYNYLKTRLEEGNTHQLAGSFDTFAAFYQTVRADGKYASGDEMHNVGEAIIGLEYGMQAGIWWGTAELARGEFVKASFGRRLAYTEHRPNWSAATVYRAPDGRVQLFAGQSERQASTTTYRYVSRDRDVYYNGVGPQREFTLVMPGGNGYGQNQPSAERVINVTWGEDIQPVINGRYVLVNRASGKVLQVTGGATANGADVQQGTYANATYQQWDVTPVNSRVGGDFSYFSVLAAHSGKSLDDFNYSLDDGGRIAQWDNGTSANQQRYLEYAGDGFFRVRSRHSAKCMDIAANGLDVVQQEVSTSSQTQQWRLLPIGAAIEFTAPAVPTNLAATASPESVRLNWTASPDADLAGYTIVRAEAANGPFTTIARGITGTAFVDNTVTLNGTYYYKLRAVDRSLNRSGYSGQVAATTTGTKDLVEQLKFDGNTLDNSPNFNHSATFGGVSYVAGKVGSNALNFNGGDAFVQLPATLANQAEITIATWVYLNGSNAWQRIFDFGNDQSQYLFLTPTSGNNTLRFGIKNGGADRFIEAPALPTGQWAHVAVTLGATGARLYVNGAQVAQSTTIITRPLDFKPVLNYIGRSQFNDPLLNGRIDEFRIYNYALAPIEVATLANPAGFYQVRNRTTSLFLDGMGRTTSGANVGQYANTADNNAFWALREVSPGYYQVQNRSSNLLLDGVGRTSDGSVCSQSTTTATTGHWSIEQFDGDFYRIRNRATGLFLDGVGRTTNGADAAQYSNTTNTNAQWAFANPLAARTATTLAAQPAFEAQKSVSLSPNPVSEVLTVHLSQSSPAAQARIFNASGQLLRTLPLTGLNTKVKVGDLPSGLYLMEVTAGAETTRSRFVKE